MISSRYLHRDYYQLHEPTNFTVVYNQFHSTSDSTSTPTVTSTETFHTLLSTISWTLTFSTTTTLPTSTSTRPLGQLTVTSSTSSTVSQEQPTSTSTSDIYTTTVESNCCPYSDGSCCNFYAAPYSYAAPTACVPDDGIVYCGGWAGSEEFLGSFLLKKQGLRNSRG